MVLLSTFAEQANSAQDLLRKRVFAALALLGLAICSAVAWSQGSSAPPNDGGCTRSKSTYTCDWAAFQRLLPHTRSVTVEMQPMDLFTAGQLRKLVGSMGKLVAAQDQPADLTMLLTPVEPSGIDFGPADRPLAMLQVYQGNSLTGGRKLLWVETFSGQPDRPWPTTAHALISQFETRLATH